MSHLPNGLFHSQIAYEQIEAAMQGARVIRSKALVAFAQRIWLGLKRAAGVEPGRFVQAARPLARALKRSASQANHARPITAAELRAVFGAPANASGGAWRKSA